MAAPNASAGAGEEGTSRKKLEEALEKLDISEEEATPLVIDDRVEGGPAKWLLVGKVCWARGTGVPRPVCMRPAAWRHHKAR